MKRRLLALASLLALFTGISKSQEWGETGRHLRRLQPDPVRVPLTLGAPEQDLADGARWRLRAGWLEEADGHSQLSIHMEGEPHRLVLVFLETDHTQHLLGSSSLGAGSLTERWSLTAEETRALRAPSLLLVPIR